MMDTKICQKCEAFRQITFVTSKDYVYKDVPVHLFRCPCLPCRIIIPVSGEGWLIRLKLPGDCVMRMEQEVMMKGHAGSKTRLEGMRCGGHHETIARPVDRDLRHELRKLKSS